MLDKIKDKILHVLRNYCGYYELEEIKGHYQNMCFNYSEDFKRHIKQLDKLSAQHESKILEYDILDNKYKTLVNIYTNCRALNNHYDIDEIIKVGNSENNYLYKKYLVAELGEILNIMKEKGVHPQDLIKRIINKANRDIKE